MSGGLDINQLTVRMGEVKLLDLDFGYSIITKLNQLTGELTFKIEMTGNEMKLAFDALPSALRNIISAETLLDADQAVETINDIEKSVRHMAEIEVRDVRAVESYMGVALSVIVIFCVIITIAYNSSTADIKPQYTRYVPNAITMLIENIYRREATPAPESAPVAVEVNHDQEMDTDAQ